MASLPPAIDESLYSRQLYVLGHDAQRKLAACDVCIVGLRGLGVEVAKNLALMGVRSLTLMDPTPASTLDLSAQFYLRESDIGSPRASSCMRALSELNQYCAVSVATADCGAGEAYWARFTVVCVCDESLPVQLQINGQCDAARRSNAAMTPPALGPLYVSGTCAGVFARMFTDFGDAHTVVDVNGEPPRSAMIASIVKGTVGTVVTLDEDLHDLEDGDFVKSFSEVRGLTGLNGCAPVRVSVVDAHTFTIGDISGLAGECSPGGVFLQVKQPQTMRFKRLCDSFTTPAFASTDPMKDHLHPVLHAAFAAVDGLAASGFVPLPGSAENAALVCQRVAEYLLRALSDEEAHVVAAFTRGYQGQVAGVCAVLGGIMAHEVTKGACAKFTPVMQWLYYDCVEALPSPLPSAEQCAVTGSRYDGQVVVFGKDMQVKLSASSLFVVGAGAIGCEALKNLAMMGACSSEGGVLTVTDMDRIEKSNLSRQLLFRLSDVGKAKSTTAAASAVRMNPSLDIRPLEARVGAESALTFPASFWRGLSCVVTALDNVEARLFVDSMCVQHRLPLLESGTQGAKGNTQVIVPGLTVNYGATRDPPEKGIPLCTLHHFPNRIEHTLQWARDWFEGEFGQTPASVNSYLRVPSFLRSLAAQPAARLDTLRKIEASLGPLRPVYMRECVEWARRVFDEKFNHSILRLLHSFPLDKLMADGSLFWTPPKRAPAPLAFDHTDPTHLEFIIACANMRAFNYGLSGSMDSTDAYAEIARWTDVAPFSLDGLPRIELPADAQQSSGGVAASLVSAPAPAIVPASTSNDAEEAALLARLPLPSSLAGFVMEEVEFDKDNDAHMRCVAAASNLRARNYSVQELDLHQSRRIAGKIIPAMASTTAVVSGLVSMELYKLLKAADTPLGQYRNAFVNLSLAFVMHSEPESCPSRTVRLPARSPFGLGSAEGAGGRVWRWSMWDKLCVHPSLGVGPLLEGVAGTGAMGDASDSDSDGDDLPEVALDGNLTLHGLLRSLKRCFGLSVTMLSCGSTLVHNSFTMGPAAVVKLRSSLHEALPAHVCGSVLLDACCEDEEGDDVDLPPLMYTCPA